MGIVKNPPPCVQFAAVFSASASLCAKAWRRLEAHWGPIADLSPPFAFVESEYYLASMGPGLQKQLALFRDPYDPARLADHKLQANAWEFELAEAGNGGGAVEPVRPVNLVRPVNIDPGYMSLTKLVLASTKNREHRIYLRDGIYAEVTLAFRDQRWQSMPWTYADYCRPDVHAFLQDARRKFSQRLARGFPTTSEGIPPRIAPSPERHR